ncbi:IS701 family transposase [Streptomyces sp. NPDC053048]|uniref:IS701 family transposase n=1 Tax=Streptomyces sp. NPDC053048 TaxID=3365694 RepID=UPI0037D7A13C
MAASDIGPRGLTTASGDADDDGDAVLADLCAELFASLQRSDQRLRAEQYVRGLLMAEGRKTLRNIADQIGGGTAQQSVHHFISDSSWEWGPVRQALLRRAEDLLAPQAWVVRPTVIPKAGVHSVGVEPRFLPELGQTVNSQQAYGAWLVSERAAVPVDWRLQLTESWLADPVRRRRANIPAWLRSIAPEECASQVVPRAAADGPRRLPVIVNAEGLDAAATVHHLDGLGAPLIVRADPTTRLKADGALLQGYSDRATTAGQLVESMRRLRRPADWARAVVTSVPVLLPGAETWRPMRLLGEWRGTDHRQARLWLTDAGPEQPTGALLRLARLARVADRDAARIADQVGIRDFVGRSFQGWHRHVTLASVAHLAVVMAGAEDFPATRAAATGTAA